MLVKEPIPNPPRKPRLNFADSPTPYNKFLATSAHLDLHSTPLRSTLYARSGMVGTCERTYTRAPRHSKTSATLFTTNMKVINLPAAPMSGGGGGSLGGNIYRQRTYRIELFYCFFWPRLYSSGHAGGKVNI